ncbi:MAG: adenylate/guanylate cyclase domain-containing protein [Rhizobiaceae bacterium]|nr:adenylate/guanylate cyclase domain-containing protein [Rhizobiaceae bacterium]
MNTPFDQDEAVSASGSFWQRFSGWFDWAVRYGVSGYDRETRRRLSICNIAGYLSALSSISFALNFLAHDVMEMRWLIFGNVLSAAITSTAPFWHRYNAVLSPIVLATTVAITLFFFVSELGRDSGIQLNYIGSVAIAFAIFGLGHMRYVAAVTVVCIVGHLSTYFLFETGRIQHLVDPAFITQLYIQSAVSIMLVLAAIVWYAFSIAADAEERSERLLKNMLPEKIAERLREEPDQIIADKFDEATVMFADIVGFTKLARERSAEELVDILNTIFSEFDRVGTELGTEKIKTIGDAYMAVCGVPEPNDIHTGNIIRLATGFQGVLKRIAKERDIDIDMRIGVATGPITAGVIGKAKFSYDVWSNTVNLAARLESHGEPGKIRVSQATYQALREKYEFEKAPTEHLKGIGRETSWYLVAEN